MITGLICAYMASCIQSLPKLLFPNPPIEQVSFNERNGRSERIFVNLEAVYPTPDELGTELSFEELRAAHRGWLGKVWQPETKLSHEVARPSSRDQTRDSSVSVEMISRDVSEKLVIAHDSPMLDENGQVKESGREGKPRRMKIKEVNATQISTYYVFEGSIQG